MSARKYLDISGLSALWTKIKNKFAEPVELTQAEYDQLSTDEKNNGKLYFITDATQGGIIDDSTTTSQTKTWSAYKINNNKVSKSGDTMTGGLTTPRVAIQKGSTNGIYVGTTVDPSGTTYDTAGPINITDNNGYTMFQIHPYHNGNGNGDMLTEFYFYCRKPNNSYVNSFSVGFDALGNPKVEFFSPSAWKTGLGLATVASSGDYTDLTNKPTIPAAQVNADWNASSGVAQILNKPTIPDISTKVSKTGDTMTGNLSMKATNVDASKANNNVSSTQYPTTFNILDNAGRIISRKEGIVQSDGQIGSYWYTRNYNTSGGQVAQKGIRMMMNKSGALTWSVDDAASFRSAIGLYYEEQNGVSGCVSSNNTTVDYIKCIRIGKMVTVTFSFSNSTAKTGELAWVALKPNFRPSGRIYFPCNIVGNSAAYANESAHRMYIYADGTMKMWIDATSATVSACMGSVSYCIN